MRRPLLVALLVLAACSRRGNEKETPRTELALLVEEDDAGTSEDASACRGEPETLATSRSPMEKAKLVADASGTLHLVYVEGPGFQRRIMYATRANGRWTAPELAHDAGEALAGVTSLALLLDPHERPWILAFVDRSRGTRPRDFSAELHVLHRESAWRQEQQTGHRTYSFLPISAAFDEGDRLHVIWDKPAPYERSNHGDDATDEFFYSVREPDGRWSWEVPVPHDDFTMQKPSLAVAKGKVHLLAGSGDRRTGGKTTTRGMTRNGATWGPLTGPLANTELHILATNPFLAVPGYTDGLEELPVYGGSAERPELLATLSVPRSSSSLDSFNPTGAWAGKTPVIGLNRAHVAYVVASVGGATRALKLAATQRQPQIAVAGKTLYAVWADNMSLRGCEVPLGERRWRRFGGAAR